MPRQPSRIPLQCSKALKAVRFSGRVPAFRGRCPAGFAVLPVQGHRGLPLPGGAAILRPMLDIPPWVYLLAAIAMVVILAPGLGRAVRHRRALLFVAIWLALAVLIALGYRYLGWRLS